MLRLMFCFSFFLCAALPRAMAGERSVVVLGRADDPRVAAVEAAVEYWNAALAAAGAPDRLRIEGAAPEPRDHEAEQDAAGGMFDDLKDRRQRNDRVLRLQVVESPAPAPN